MSIQTDAIKAIEAQQTKVQYHSLQWQVGEQLKDICRHEPRSAELIAQDLENEAMSIVEAEKKIAAFARKNNGRASGFEADRILREFYGLPGSGAAATLPDRSLTPEAAMTVPGSSGIIDLSDFL